MGNRDEVKEEPYYRLNSLVSQSLSVNGSVFRNNSGERNQNKWAVDESTPDINMLLNEIGEDEDFTQINLNSKNYKINNRREADIMIAKFGQSEEETKHENSVSDSINAEIDEMIYGNFDKSSKIKNLNVDQKVIAGRNSERNQLLNCNTSNKSNSVLRIESNNSEFERIASMILRDNSRNHEKKNYLMKDSLKSKDPQPSVIDTKSTFEEPELMHLRNLKNQPDEKVFNKRKAAAQYIPYGVYAKQSGGLGKTEQKFFVRPDLMFYSKYDKRLVAEIVKNDQASKKDADLAKGKQVIILSQLKGKILVCPINSSVMYKSSVPTEVKSVGKLLHLIRFKI